MPLPPLEKPKESGRRLRGLAIGLPLVGGLGVTLLGVNGAQLASVVVRPFSRRAFRRFNRWIADSWWGWTLDVAKRLHGVGITTTGDDVPDRENAIVVVNHQEMPDITFLMRLAREKGRLGDMKWFVKHSLKYVPGVGWGMSFLDCFFVRRDWAADQAGIERTFESIKSGDVPIWLVMFVEGTRIRPGKTEKARAFAEERGWTPTEHVLIPRTKGFVAAVRGLRGHVRAVYDITVGYEGGVPTLWQYTEGFARHAHLHVRRWDIDSLPEDEDALASWLRERFVEKDALLAYYYENGAFPATRDLPLNPAPSSGVRQP